MNYFITYDLVTGGCLHYISNVNCSSGIMHYSLSHKRSDAFIFEDYDVNEIQAIVDYLNTNINNCKVYPVYSSGKFQVTKYSFNLHVCKK